MNYSIYSVATVENGNTYFGFGYKKIKFSDSSSMAY